MGGEEREGREEGMGRQGKGGGEEGTRRGPQFKKNDLPSSDAWLRACLSREPLRISAKALY